MSFKKELQLKKENRSLRSKIAELSKSLVGYRETVDALKHQNNKLSIDSEFKDNRIKELEDDKKDLNKQLVAEARKYPELPPLKLDSAFVEHVRVFTVNTNSKKEVNEFQEELNKYVQEGTLMNIDQLSLGNGKASYIVIYRENIGK